MAKMFFAPDGSPITSPAAYSFNSPDIEINDDGTAGLGAFGDFPSFEHFELPGLGNVLVDSDGSDWLESHCRLIEVYEDFDPWSTDNGAPVWPEEIVGACSRVQRLGQTLWCVKKLRDWSPADIRDDPAITAAVNHLIVGRVQDEIDRLQAQIKAWRAVNPDVTVIEEPEEIDDVPA